MFARLKYLAFIGLLPYGDTGRICKLQAMYTILLIASNVVLTAYVVCGKSEKREVTVAVLVSEIMFVGQQLCMAVTLVETMFNYAGYYAYYNAVARLQAHLECSTQQNNISLRRYFLVALLAYGSLGFSIGASCLLYFYKGWFVYSIGAVLLIRTKFLLLMYFVEHMGRCLAALAENLQRILAARSAHHDKDTDNDQCAHLSSSAYLLELKQFYREIHQLNTCFNELHGWSTLGLLVVTFLDTICNMYWIFIVLLDIYDDDLAYLHGSRLLPNLLFLVLYCLRCEYCRQQHQFICTLLRRLMRTNSQDAATFAYNELLEEFATQLQQTKFVISAKGYMRIDLQLLVSILTALVTYIMLLTQFRLSGLAYNGDV